MALAFDVGQLKAIWSLFRLVQKLHEEICDKGLECSACQYNADLLGKVEDMLKEHNVQINKA